MKHGYRYLFASSLVIGLFFLLFWAPKPALAATVTFTNPDGGVAGVDTNNLSHFKWGSPLNVSSDVSGHSIEYNTSANPCDMIQCGGSSSAPGGFHPSNYIWYWPGGKPSTDVTYKDPNLKAGGFCPSALVINLSSIQPRAGPAHLNTEIDVVNLIPEASGKCVFNTDGSNTLDGAQMQGRHEGSEQAGQSNASSYGTVFSAAPSGVVNAMSGSHNSLKASLYAFATDWGWRSANEIDSYPGGSVFTYRDPGKEQTIVGLITATLAKSTDSPNVQNYTTSKGYRYYVSDDKECTSDKVYELIVVNKADERTLHLLHINGNNGQYIENWDSGHQGPRGCVFGHNVYQNSPAAIYGGDGASDVATLGLGDASLVYITCTADDGKSPDITVNGLQQNCPTGYTPTCSGNQVANTTGGCDAGSVATDTGGTGLNVHCNLGWNPLSWFLCPLANSLIGLSHTFENFINTNLCIPTDPAQNQNFATCDSGSSNNNASSVSGGNNLTAYKGAWSAMRAIALGLLAVIALIAIVSQATSLDIFDAYTIKKIMPRLLFAGIAVSLSWPLLNWFINLTNDLGYGVRYLIYNAVSGSGLPKTVSFGPDFTAGFFGSAAIGAFGIFGLLSFAATAALFTAVAFLILIIRQIAVIALVIFAPIAIMLYASPFGRQLAGRWWKEFTQMTLAFPMIAGAIAIGHVFGAIGLSSDNAAAQMIGFVGYLAGDLAVVGILLKSGQILGAAGGAIQKQAQKGYGMLSSRRSKGMQARWSDRVTRARNRGIFRDSMLQINQDTKWLPKKFTQGLYGKGGKYEGKEHGVGKFLNSALMHAADFDENVPVHVNNLGKLLGKGLSKASGGKIGKTWESEGVPIFRRKTELIGSKIAHAKLEQANEAYKSDVASVHYETKGALAFGARQDWFAETEDDGSLKRDTNGHVVYNRKAVDRLKQLGIVRLDTDGNEVRDNKGQLVFMRPDNKFETLHGLGEVMAEFGETQKVKLAGQELKGKAAKYSSYREDPKLYRADKQLAAMGLTGIGAAGKASLDEIVTALEQIRQEHGQDFANEMYEQLSQVGSQVRPETGSGQAILMNPDGSFFNAYGITDENDARFPSVEAHIRETITKLTAAQLGGANRESFVEMGPHIVRILQEASQQGLNTNGTFKNSEDEYMFNQVLQSIGIYGQNNPEAKAELLNIINKSGADVVQRYEEFEAAQEGYKRVRQQTGTRLPPPSVVTPAAPPGPPGPGSSFAPPPPSGAPPPGPPRGPR